MLAVRCPTITALALSLFVLTKKVVEALFAVVPPPFVLTKNFRLANLAIVFPAPVLTVCRSTVLAFGFSRAVLAEQMRIARYAIELPFLVLAVCRSAVLARPLQFLVDTEVLGGAQFTACFVFFVFACWRRGTLGAIGGELAVLTRFERVTLDTFTFSRSVLTISSATVPAPSLSPPVLTEILGGADCAIVLHHLVLASFAGHSQRLLDERRGTLVVFILPYNISTYIPKWCRDRRGCEEWGMKVFKF